MFVFIVLVTFSNGMSLRGSWAQGNANKKIYKATFFFIDYLLCRRWCYFLKNMQAYDVLGLYYGLGRTFFNPASVWNRLNIFTVWLYINTPSLNLVETLFNNIQTKVFSRFDEIREATKNYTIQATPEDRSSVLQQVLFFARQVF